MHPYIWYEGSKKWMRKVPKSDNLRTLNRLLISSNSHKCYAHEWQVRNIVNEFNIGLVLCVGVCVHWTRYAVWLFVLLFRLSVKHRWSTFPFDISYSLIQIVNDPTTFLIIITKSGNSEEDLTQKIRKLTNNLWYKTVRN